nr:hypothetical protein [Tanacetum cinerariifolium]
MQPLRQSQRLPKSHQDKSSGVSVSNSESSSTGGQSEQKKNKKRSTSSSSAKPLDQTKKSKLSYAPEVKRANLSDSEYMVGQLLAFGYAEFSDIISECVQEEVETLSTYG